MAFLDEAVITLQSGNGGPGCMSFRRERYLPRGGPDGGDGGKGGDLLLVGRSRLTTLEDGIRGTRRFLAKNGAPGGPNKCHGKNGPDLTLELPVGTMVRDAERGHLLAELMTEDESVLLLKGGKGGRGNWSFRSSVRRAPRHAQKGVPGELRKVRLELKLLADVGLVGLPNAGKSTLLTSITRAAPKIGHYPFTTLQPRIGVIEHDFETMTMADLPGLLEGAHEGRGLGDRFLRHIERTRILLHLVDVSEGEPESWIEAYRTVRHELENYGGSIPGKPEFVVFTKTDLLLETPSTEEFRSATGRSPFLISAPEGDGLESLIGELFKTSAAG